MAMLKIMRTGPLFTPPSMQGTIMRPGTLGGADWAGGAFDPDTGFLYVKENASPTLMRPRIPDQDGNMPENAGNGAAITVHRGIPVLKPPYAFLDAVDLNKGELVWQVPFGDDAALRKHPALAGVKLPEKLGAVGDAGVIATKSGLLFVGGGDEAFHAVDEKTGQDLWVYPTPGLKTNGTPMTYGFAGKQYVVIAVGGAGTDASLLAFGL